MGREGLSMLDGSVGAFLTRGASYRGYSVETIATYQHSLSGFLGFARAKGISDPRRVTSRLVSEYVYELNGGGRAKQPQTIAKDAAAISALFDFLTDTGVVKANPVRGVKLPKVPNQREMRVLTRDEARQLVDACRTAEERAVIDLMLHTGLRRAEVTEIRLSDVNLTERSLGVRGKGGQGRVTREIALHDRALTAIELQLTVRPSDKSDFLFVGGYGGQMGTSRVNKLVARAAARAGLRGVHPHTLRHTFATLWLQGTEGGPGADIETLRVALGHQDYSMTQRYAHTSVRTMRRQLNRYSV